jgi:phosphatidyl-myo-inositol dimannoside synthase
MRLLFISTEFPPGPGGIGSHAYEIAKNLQRVGWDITILTKQDNASEDEIKKFNASQPFRVITVPPQRSKALKLFHWLKESASLMKQLKPDVVLASGISAVLVSALAAKLHQQTLIIVAHGEFPAGWQRSWMRWSLRHAKALICVSAYTREQMRSLSAETLRTETIPNGGDSLSFYPLPEKDVKEFRKSLGFADSYVLLTVGKVWERKGQDIVIRALPHILRKIPNTHYVVVGLPECKPQFENIAADLGVSQFVHFMGVVETSSLVKFLNACDVFVMLSRHTERQYEAYGIAVVEAALCGRPAVVSANSGLTESILPGQTGIAVQEEDSLAAAEAIITLLENSELRKQLGETARAMALENSTWEQRALRYDHLLKQVASET